MHARPVRRSRDSALLLVPARQRMAYTPPTAVPSTASGLVMLGLPQRCCVSMKRTVPEEERMTMELVDAPPE